MNTKSPNSLNPSPTGAGDDMTRVGVAYLTGEQIRLRIANVLLGQGVKLNAAEYLRARLDEIYRVVVKHGLDRAQLRYEVVELCAARGIDMTTGDTVIDMINGLDAVVMNEPTPPTMAQQRAAAEAKKAKKGQ